MQDKSGDTALNIAARIGNRSIIQQMLEVGADASIPNRAGLKPLDFGVGKDGQATEHRVAPTPLSPDRSVSRVVGETSQDIISCGCIALQSSRVPLTIPPAMSSLLSGTEKEFASEMRAKQDLIDATHAQLRECSAILGEERRKLDGLQKRAAERTKRQEKIANLARAAQEQRARLAQSGLVNGESSAPVKIGDADAGMESRSEDMPPALHLQAMTNDNDSVSLGPAQAYYTILSGLPPTRRLRARLNAYTSNNRALRGQAARLKSCSSELEAKYRRVVSLCTGAPEAEVEKLLVGLVEAIDSEGAEAMEIGRLRDFLRRVEGVE